MIFNREPVLVMTVVQAVIALGTSFGLGWSAEQVGAVMAATAAALAFITRTKVSPVNAGA